MTKYMPTVSEEIAEFRDRHRQMTIELNEHRRYARNVSINSLLVGLLIVTNLVLMTEMTIIAVLLLTWPSS